MRHLSDDTDSTETPATEAPPPRRRWAWRWLLGVVALVVLVPVLLAGAALWHLQENEIAAPDWLRDRVEDRASRDLPGMAVRFGDVSVALGEGWQPSLHLRDVALLPRSGGQPITLSDVRTSFDGEALMQGEIRPSVVRVSGARVQFQRDEDGLYGVAFGARIAGPPAPDGAEAGTGEAREVGESLDALGAMLSQPVFASLVRIEGSGLTLRYDDRRSGRAWTVDGGRLELVRQGDDLRLRADLALLGGRSYVTTIESTVTGRIGSRAVTVAVQVEDMPARDIATQSAGLAWLGILDAPISGAFRLTTSLDGEIGPLNGTLQIGAGALAPEGTEEPVPFRSARSYFQYDPGTQAVSFNELSVQSAWVTAVAEGRIVLENITDGVPEAMIGQLRITELTTNPAGIYPVPLYLEGAEADMRLRLSPFRLELGRLDLRDRGETLRLSGWADAREEGWDLSLTGRMAELSADDLLELWPTSALDKTREWVARNVLDGVIRDIQLGLRSEPMKQPDLYVGFTFEELITTFMKTLPPIEGGSGRAELRDNRFVVTADGGEVYAPGGGPLAVAGTSFIYEDVTVKRGPAEVRLKLDGGLRDVLVMLDQEPFEYLSKANRTPDMASGQASLDALLNFNLVKKLQPDEIRVAYSGVLRDVESDRIVPGKTLTADRLEVTGDTTVLRVAGEGRMGAIPFGGAWEGQLGPEAGGRSQVAGWLTLSEDFARDFNLGLPPGTLSGAARAEIEVDMARGTLPEFRLTSDLKGLGLRLDDLDWSMSRGATGQLEIAGELATPTRIDLVRIDAPGLSAQGNVSLRAGGGLDRARFSSVRIGNWLNAPVVLTGRGKGAAPAVSVSGGSVDLRNVSMGGGSGQGGPITLTLDRLQISDTIALRGMRGEFTNQGGLSGRFTGSINGRAPIEGTLVPRDGRTAVRLTAANAGAALSAAGLLKKGAEGALELTLLPAGGQGSYDGRLSVKDIWLQDAPAMASLLSTLSIVGLLEQMSGKGILFSDVQADFRLSPSQVILRSSSAVGASMGVTMDGVYDLGTQQMDMQGVFSPLYLINGIGQVVSRRGEGLIGFNYGLRGPVSDPRVSVNPLSLFTPGIFREIFRRPAPEVN